MLPKILYDLPVLITSFLLIGKCVSEGFISYYMGIGYIIILFSIIILTRYRANEGISEVVRITFRVALPIVNIIILIIIYTGGFYYRPTVELSMMLILILMFLGLYFLTMKWAFGENLNRRSFFFDCIMILGACGLIINALLNKTIALNTAVIILLVIMISIFVGQIFRGKTKRTLSLIFRFGLPLVALGLFVLPFGEQLVAILVLFVICLFVYYHLPGFSRKHRF